MHLPNIAQHVSFAPITAFKFAMIALVAHLVWPQDTFDGGEWALVVGIALLALGTLIGFLAENHRVTAYCENGTMCHRLGEGPYKFSRHPKYLGYLLLIVGLGFVLTSWFLLASSLVVFLVLTFFLIPKQEELLEKQFPGLYQSYKDRVRMWL